MYNVLNLEFSRKNTISHHSGGVAGQNTAGIVGTVAAHSVSRTYFQGRFHPAPLDIYLAGIELGFKIAGVAQSAVTCSKPLHRFSFSYVTVQVTYGS